MAEGEEGSRQRRKEVENEINIKTKNNVITGKDMSQRIIRYNVADKLKRYANEYIDRLAKRFGTTAIELCSIDKRIKKPFNIIKKSEFYVHIQ